MKREASSWGKTARSRLHPVPRALAVLAAALSRLARGRVDCAPPTQVLRLPEGSGQFPLCLRAQSPRSGSAKARGLTGWLPSLVDPRQSRIKPPAWICQYLEVPRRKQRRDPSGTAGVAQWSPSALYYMWNRWRYGGHLLAVTYRERCASWRQGLFAPDLPQASEAAIVLSAVDLARAQRSCHPLRLQRHARAPGICRGRPPGTRDHAGG